MARMYRMKNRRKVVDDQDGIGDPTGMTGTRLEVNVHVITCSTTAAQNTVTCVNRFGPSCSRISCSTCRPFPSGI